MINDYGSLSDAVRKSNRRSCGAETINGEYQGERVADPTTMLANGSEIGSRGGNAQDPRIERSMNSHTR